MSSSLVPSLSMDTIYKSFGGKENISPNSIAIIRDAFELAIEQLTSEISIYPEDEIILSNVLIGKIRTNIEYLSRSKGVPILLFSDVSLSIDAHRKINSQQIKLAIIQIGLDASEFISKDTETGVLYKLKNPSKIGEIILDAISKVSKDVDFICLPECSIPADDEFLGTLAKISRERGQFIIAGSYHDFSSRLNTSLIITPNRERFTQHKIKAAQEYGEGLKPRIYCAVKVFHAPMFRFSVLICSDVSLDSVVNLFKARSMRCKGIDIVFNPSYTKALGEVHNSLRNFCSKTLSYVAFTNSAEGGSVTFGPKKFSADHSLMLSKPLAKSNNLEVEISEFKIDVKNLRIFRSSVNNIDGSNDCFISPY